MDENYLDAVVCRYKSDKNIHKIISVKYEPAAPEGENYLSRVTRVQLEVILKCGRKRKISIIAKEALKDCSSAEWTKETGVFNTEIRVYNTILDKMSDLMIEFNDKRGKLWADLIASQPTMMILQDLKEKDFHVANRHNCLDVVHAKLVLRSLSRFHAMSKILLRQKYITKEDVKPNPFFANKNLANLVWGNGLKILAREMKLWGNEWSDIRERILKYSDTVADKLAAICELNENCFNVINHGDPWICNMMFKYEPYERVPIAVKFVDYQISNYCSFAWDVIYFLTTSLHGAVRRKHMDELLKCYITALRDNLLMYGLPEKELPSLDTLKKDMDGMHAFTLAVCLLTHPIMTSTVEKSYSLNEGLRPEEFVNCGFNPEVFKSAYIEEIGPDLRRFAEIGVI